MVTNEIEGVFNMETFKRKTSSDIVYDNLKKQIVTLEIPPHFHLSEMKIADDHEVSRTIIRQCLSRLQVEGLLIKRRNGRVYTLDISKDDAINIYNVRSVLEGLVAKEATNKITQAGLNDLEVIIESIKDAILDKNDEAIINYGFYFHYKLYEISKNDIAVNFLNRLRPLIERYRYLTDFQYERHINHSPLEEHIKLFELIRQRKESEVELEMIKHVNNSLEYVLLAIDAYKKRVKYK